MAGIFGTSVKLGMDEVSTLASITKRFDFQNESLALQETFLDTGGLRGTRSHAIERVRQSTRFVTGSIVLQPTAVELAIILPWILGADASGTTFALAETLQEFAVAVARDDGTDGKVFLYTGCKVNRATFSAAQGGPLTVTMEIVGKDETVSNAATFPSLTIDTTTNAFMFHDADGAISIGGSAYDAKSFEIIVDNVVSQDRFFNNQTLQTIQPTDRIISVNFDLPYGDAEAAYTASSSSGVAVTVTLTNGNVSCLFSMVKVAYPRQSPVTTGREEVMVRLAGTAYKSSTTEPLVVTLDSTP